MCGCGYGRRLLPGGEEETPKSWYSLFLTTLLMGPFILCETCNLPNSESYSNSFVAPTALSMGKMD